MSHLKIIIVSIISFFLFTLFLHFSVGGYIVKKQSEGLLYNIKSTEYFIKKSIDVLIAEKKIFYISKSKIIFSDDAILSSLEKRDRESFYKLAKPYFDNIKSTDNNFWGLHLILPNNLSFIRVHKSYVEDKLIEKGKKPLIDEVNEKKEIVTSFDAGKFGYFLRVVTPVFSKNNNYLAVAEFSVNVDLLSEYIKEMFAYEVQFLVKNFQNKPFLKDLPQNPDGLVIFKTTNAELFNSKSDKNYLDGILSFKKKFYKTVTVQLSPTVSLQSAFDITDILNKHIQFKTQLFFFTLATNFVVLLLWVFFTRYYIKKYDIAQNEIDKQREDIDRLNERYLLTFDAIKDAIWDWNLKTKEVYFSKRWKNMIGYQEDEIENNADVFFQLIHNDDKQRVEKTLAKHFENPKENKYSLEIRLLCKDGTYKWILARGECYLDNEGEPKRMLGVHTDIDERKKSEEFIRNSNTILKMVAMGEPAFLVYNKIALMYESRHPGMRCSLLELNEGKLMHGGAPSMPKEYCDAVNELRNGPNVGSCGTSTYYGERVVVEDIKTDPKWKDIKHYALPHGMRSCWSEPIKSSLGEVLGAFGMYYNYPALPNEEESKDLTSAARLAGIVMERDQSQKRISLNQKLLSEQSKLAAMGEMIGNIAHQWRQPLSLISTISTSVLFHKKMGLLNEESLEKDMNIINDNSQYLSKTIDDFREFLQVNKEMKESSIKEALEHSLTLTDAYMKNNYITLVSSIDDDIIIKANKNELVQSFINIINNAKDVLQESQPEKERYIFVSTNKLEDETLELLISDSGGGIDKKYIDRVFEPYFTTKHQSFGTGIGLSMVNKILREKYKVHISVSNQEHFYKDRTYYGACFRMIFKRIKSK